MKSKLSSVVKQLKKSHPHSIDILRAFVPLLEVQYALADEFTDSTELPDFDRHAFLQGKPWLRLEELCFPESFLKKGTKKIAVVAAKSFPGLKEEIQALGAYLSKKPQEAFDLVQAHLHGKTHLIRAWAKKQNMSAQGAVIMITHLCAAGARCAKGKAEKMVLPKWEKGYCPICGSRPHGSTLKKQEGYRHLECSRCGYEWRFARTVCPVCEERELQKLPVFTFDDHPDERVDGCEECKHYLLGLDTRKLADPSEPLALRLLCMLPLDMLMQEKGYTAVVEA